MEGRELDRFNRNFFESGNPISYIGSGSLGGKAQGLTFIDKILDNIQAEEFPGFEISIPRMIVLRTDIFDSFMEQNKLSEIAFSDASDERIGLAFQKADLPFEILGDLRTLISNIKQPLAIRSSSMLEDAMYEPFAGIYGTKMTPNNQHDIDTRFRKLTEAIKFVYASTYFKAAKDYMKATKHKTEDEKMAVIIQEVVGESHNERFYPEVSGVARSYNFYPVGHATPEEGVVNLALGMGKTIVDGSISWTYSPSYPRINPPFKSTGDMLKQTQISFWAINMGKPPEYNPIQETEYLMEAFLPDAESDGTLKHLVSTYDVSSDRIWPGISGKGPRILTFSPILTLDTILLNDLTKKLLKNCEEAVGAPVEIEFAVTLANQGEHPYRFGFLQVRPMVVSSEEVNLAIEELTGENILAASEKVLGNGVIDSISDIVFTDPEAFQTRFSREIAAEIGSVNSKLLEEKKAYLLIGFGRWGTSDPTAGIPVNWGQVSGAKVIIEATMENVFVEMSQGSHFFHNVTGFKVHYFSIPFASIYGIDWDWLAEQNLIEEGKYIKHIRLASPLHIKVDGRSGRGVINKSNP